MIMNKRVSIGILEVAVLLAFLVLLMAGNGRREEDVADSETERSAKVQQASESERPAEDSGHVAQESEADAEESEASAPAGPADTVKYVILPRDGNLVVYYSDYTTEYFDTGIEVLSLPDETIDQVVSGITFSSEEELFAFLESYSS